MYSVGLTTKRQQNNKTWESRMSFHWNGNGSINSSSPEGVKHQQTTYQAWIVDTIDTIDTLTLMSNYTTHCTEMRIE